MYFSKQDSKILLRVPLYLILVSVDCDDDQRSVEVVLAFTNKQKRTRGGTKHNNDDLI
jgi:hypothetical protein